MKLGSGATVRDRIGELEQELSNTKYNKRTQHAIGLLKAKIANLKEKAERHEKRVGLSQGYSVKKTGDATVVILGWPSVGKSTLLNKITNAKSLVASYAFTTLSVIPGLMEYKHAKIQLLDMPGVLEGAASGAGRGREALAVIRSADLLLILVDATQPPQLATLQGELYAAGVRLNESAPDVRITKTARGGILIGRTVRLTKIAEPTIKAILNEFRISNAQVLIREDISADQLIDTIKGNRKYLPSITVANKVDMVDAQSRALLGGRFDVLVSALNEIGLEELKDLIFQRLGIMRVFCKEAGKRADTQVPVILRKGSTVEDVCKKLHKDFVRRFRFAKVWGRSAKFGGQQLGMSHQLQDEDIVEIHLL
jgi:small GTP-binding protein